LALISNFRFQLFLVLLLLVSHVQADISTSANYHLSRAVIGSSSSYSVLPSYHIVGVAGQGSPAGVAVFTSRNLKSGYVPRVPWIDHDGDGMYSSWEIANNLDQYQSSDAYSDDDLDHMTAVREFLANLDPNDSDSDDDGVDDGDDFFPLDSGQWRLALDGIYKGLETSNNLEKIN